MFTSRKQIATMLIIVFYNAPAMAGEASGIPQSPTDTVNHFLNRRHGLSWLGEEENRAIADMKRNPSLYFTALAPVLKMPKDATSLYALPSFYRYGRALELAGQIGSAHAVGVLREFYVNASKLDMRETRIKQREKPSNDNLLILRSVALKKLGELKDASLIPMCISSMETEDIRIRTEMLRYFESVGGDNSEVMQFLLERTGNNKSRLYRDSQAVQVLEILSASVEVKNRLKSE